MFKNVANQRWRVFAFDRTNNQPKTGDAANITAKIRKDYGTATATGDANPTEIEDGYYEFDLTQPETNANCLELYPESSTANVQVIGVPGTIYTRPANFADLAVAAGTGTVTVGTNQDKTGYGLSASERAAIADGLLVRDMDQVETTAPEHSLCTVVLAILESQVAGTTWTIKRTDGSTTHATKTVTKDAGAEPITGVS